ncbi:PucR family transcriptional regulator [Clostridium sp. WLY-B-L2]|uniref:PucR family transcriptional regulator n=1 Tax=Clostridium aromativorans TaxID=2836848 RepID=A0ABS8N901_9CLOT|nr:PucR family transcriptional regulator [Clostridium aromativorans]MCC9296291.1 PucR family transcriptional regulator [Clostridium aromativorans]CAB1248752.1 Purine catabolism regulatory protein [Clostridiaceae bacterium BL-3]
MDINSKNSNKLDLKNSLLVREVLSIPAFESGRVIAGKNGLDNECRNITIIETPDGIEWLEGDEFLLSAGYAFKDKKDELDNAVYRAYKKGAAALAIKEKRYIDVIPQKMIDQSNEYNIPLIVLPCNFIYTKALSSFYNSLLYKKNKHIYESKKMHDRLLRLMLEDKNAEDTIKALSELTGLSIIILDSVFNLVYKNIVEKLFDTVNDMVKSKVKEFAANKMHDHAKIKCYGYDVYIYRLSYNNKLLGYMYVINRLSKNSIYMDVIENGKRMLELKLAKEKNKPLNIVNVNMMITNMILNSRNLPDKFYSNIKNDYGWNDKSRFIGICINVNRGLKNDSKILGNQLNEEICNLIARIFNGHGFFITEENSRIILFFCLEDVVSLDYVVKKINNYINNYNNSMRVFFSVSRSYDDIVDIPKMYNECYIASLFNTKKNIVLYYDSLDTIKLLYPLKENMQTFEYCSKTLGGIKEYDSKNKSELLRTLECFFKYNMKKKLVANKLHIHPETLRYRLNKIEDLTGYSLHSSEGIFALQIGIKLYRMIKD